jgi:demethylmenaquinone methyltransferase/2-methoxy-6-polyprenyl-1,4-benzoquinol methylase
VKNPRADARATLAKRRAEVAGMFDEVAPRYDLMNGLASLGQERAWRDEVVRALGVKPGEAVLDLAAGTGASSVPLAEAGGTVVCVDLSAGMVAEGRRRHPELGFVLGDALALPFVDGAFDKVTISFGLRNVEDTSAGLAELLRVTKPGGRIVVCEFSTPTWRPFRGVYHGWIRHVMPKLSRVASADPAAYTYLTESILDWPDQKALARLMERAGWSGIEWRNLTGGVVALHRATKP